MRGEIEDSLASTERVHKSVYNIYFNYIVLLFLNKVHVAILDFSQLCKPCCVFYKVLGNIRAICLSDGEGGCVSGMRLITCTAHFRTNVGRQGVLKNFSGARGSLVHAIRPDIECISHIYSIY